MSAEPRNAATERLEFHVAGLHKTAALPRSLYTDDFVSEDHRRLIRLPTVVSRDEVVDVAGAGASLATT